MKTSELTGPALDWAVAKAENFLLFRDPDGPNGWELIPGRYRTTGEQRGLLRDFNPSTDWSQGGPIIEREEISVTCSAKNYWRAFLMDADEFSDLEAFASNGPTALTAAMRCFVASKLGDEVDVPEELK